MVDVLYISLNSISNIRRNKIFAIEANLLSYLDELKNYDLDYFTWERIYNGDVVKTWHLSHSSGQKIRLKFPVLDTLQDKDIGYVIYEEINLDANETEADAIVRLKEKLYYYKVTKLRKITKIICNYRKTVNKKVRVWWCWRIYNLQGDENYTDLLAVLSHLQKQKFYADGKNIIVWAMLPFVFLW